MLYIYKIYKYNYVIIKQDKLLMRVKMRKFNKKIFSLAAIIGLGTITTCSTVITSCGASEAKNLTIDGVPTVIGTIINNAGS